MLNLLQRLTFQVLISYVEDCIKSGNLIEELSLNPVSAGEKGLKLLVVSEFGVDFVFVTK